MEMKHNVSAETDANIASELEALHTEVAEVKSQKKGMHQSLSSIAPQIDNL